MNTTGKLFLTGGKVVSFLPLLVVVLISVLAAAVTDLPDLVDDAPAEEPVAAEGNLPVEGSPVANDLTGAAVVEESLSPVAAHDRDDYLKLVYNTDHCISNCQTVYKICPYDKDDRGFDLDFKDEDRGEYDGYDANKKFKKELKGDSFHLKDLEMEYKAQIETEVPVYGTCEISEERVNNETGRLEGVTNEVHCQKGTTTVLEEGREWKTFTPEKIKQVPENGCFDLKISGKIGWGDYVDNVVSFGGYRYDEYAAWVGDVQVHTLTADFSGSGTNVTNASDKLALVAGSGGDTLIDAFTYADGNLPGNGNWSQVAARNQITIQDNKFHLDNDFYAEKHIGDKPNFDYMFTFQGNTTFNNMIACVRSKEDDNLCWHTNGVDAFLLEVNQDLSQLRIGLGGNRNVNNTAFTWTTGVNYSVRYQFNDSSSGELRLKAWDNKTAEPGSWGVEYAPTQAQNEANKGHFMQFLSIAPGGTNVGFGDNLIEKSAVVPYVQGYYVSQKVDTGNENETLRINVSTNNVSAMKYEARVATNDTNLDSANWFAFSHDTDFSTRGRWVQYRMNFTHDLAEVYELNLSRRIDTVGNEPSDEATARNLMELAINASLTGHTIYTDQRVYLRSSSNSQVVGTVDKLVVRGNKRWLFNYPTGTEDNTTAWFNITPVIYSWQWQNRTATQIDHQVRHFIGNTT